MSELTGEARLQAVAALIEQAPPGEVNDVINSIRQIIADDDALMPHAGKALRAYNLASLTVVQHEAKDGVPAHTSILSEAAILPGSVEEQYIDPTGKRSFTFDHLTMAPAGYEPYQLPDEEEAFRAELAKSLAAYTKNHFSSGQSAVQCSQYPLLPALPEPTVEEPAAGSSKAPEPPTVAESTSEEEVAAAVPADVEPATEQAETTPASPIEPLSNAPSASAPVNPKYPIEDGTATTADETAAEVQSDVVDEQISGGADEPAPTPAPAPAPAAAGSQDGDAGEAPAETVQGDAELEKVDSGVKEAKGEEVERKDTPVVEEEGGSAPEDQATLVEQEAPVQADVPAPVPRKQQRVDSPVYTLEVVGNKYKTDAFWTGRWRTRWTVDKAANKVEGKINVDVHYFEQGNVQLATSHTAAFDYPSESSSQSIPSQIVTTIAKLETAYQMELQDVYGDLGEKAFRSLRRALPVTRHKIDWEKVGGYNLRTDIGQAAS